MPRSFAEALEQRVLVCDGAMGTMLYSKGVFINKSFDALNITQPEIVLDVHNEYVRAGADVIETNTFGANRIKLGSFGLASSLHEINVAGVTLARKAAGDQAFVAGSIGPLGIRIEPWGKTGVDEARQYFGEQAQALVDGGVDLFILETFRDLNEIGAAIDAVRAISDLPIIAQMTTEEDGNTLDGTPPERFAPELERRGATVIGVNCAVGPAPMLDTIRSDGGVDLFILETFRDLNEIGAAIDAVRSISDLPIVAQMTTEEDGNTLDGTPPERFAPELEKRGATILGVNCAVGPAPMLDTIERT